ncbi:probable G-protein coupled receptor Mth-like 3 isoform X1 [Daphnia pulicaria]|uniref:probable G-protein coupled receptor Mth-like 3 isoform X1 n=1 Tax=Daphnia pulicaria TaxID=35523 RepID=UPI001EEC42A2|nr:probable G-protein coupled receptor Mth-like 3 isoform X1 [Daphnia pulicaria]XP_046636276.1 probable G-protein coupled receptor Mth-like 3 isoform X1 [Daphnia pulicaria]
MANKYTLGVVYWAFFVWFSYATATTSEDKTLSEMQRNSSIRQQILFDEKIWCCKSGTTYLTGLDQCVPNFVSTLYTESFPNYSFENATDGLTDCPEGYVSHSTEDFQLDNETLLVSDKRLESNEFCINRIEEENYSTSPGKFVARYCVPDPCSESGCIRKCCPPEMAMVTKYYHDLLNISICEPHPVPFNLSLLRNPKNEPIDANSFVTRGGLGIKCGNLPRESISSFSIRQDGQIVLHLENQTDEKTDQYCIENLVDGEDINVMAMVCFPEQGEDSKGAFLFGCLNLFATIFLVATLLVYSILPKMRNLHGVIVMCYLASMTVTNVFHAILMLVRGSDMPPGLCPTLAILLHFGYIATFSWLNVLCFGVWRMFSSIRLPTRISVLSKQFFYSSLYGWGIPFIVVVVGQILQHSDVPDDIIKPGLASKLYCWFNHKHRGPLISYLYAPMMVMIVANVFMFAWAAFNFYQRSAESSQVTNVLHNGQRFRVILSLFLLMGVPWTTEIITFMADASFESALVTDIFNIILPIFIFIIFVCKPSVWKMLKQKFPRLSPFISNCGKFSSRIIPKKINRHQPSSAEESNSDNTNDISYNNKTSQQTLSTDSTADMKEVFQLPITRSLSSVF